MIKMARMTNIKKTKDIKCWPGCGGKRMLAHYCGDCKLVQPLWRFLKTKNRTTHDSAMPPLGTSKGNEISMSKRHLHSRVHCSTIHKSQEIGTTELSVKSG
jgi:hypothetical protein